MHETQPRKRTAQVPVLPVKADEPAAPPRRSARPASFNLNDDDAVYRYLRRELRSSLRRHRRDMARIPDLPAGAMPVSFACISLHDYLQLQRLRLRCQKKGLHAAIFYQHSATGARVFSLFVGNTTHAVEEWVDAVALPFARLDGRALASDGADPAYDSGLRHYDNFRHHDGSR